MISCLGKNCTDCRRGHREKDEITGSQAVYAAEWNSCSDAYNE